MVKDSAESAIPTSTRDGKDTKSKKTTAEQKPSSTEAEAGFSITPDMQEFIEMKRATGRLVTGLDTKPGQEAFLRDYNSWVAAGRPKALMPEYQIKENPPPIKLYRIRDRGRQKIFWRTVDGKLHGKRIVEIPIEESVENSLGEKKTVVTRKIQAEEYTVDYTVEFGKKLLEDALKRAPFVMCAFVTGRRNQLKYAVRPEDFNGDFDQIIRLHQEKKYFLEHSSLGSVNNTTMGGQSPHVLPDELPPGSPKTFDELLERTKAEDSKPQ